MTFRALLTISTMALLAGCSSSAGEAGASRDTASQATSSRGGSVNACDILTAAFVKDALGADDLPIEDGTSDGASTYSSCTITWDSSRTREMTVAGRTMTVPDTNRITLSVSIFEPGRSQVAYDAGVRRLREQNDFEPVSDVGEEATWYPAMRQISVRGSSHVFHLALHYPDGEGEPLDYATTMAGRVFEELE